MFLNVITHIKNSVIVSFKYKLFKEMYKMSSAAAQKASTKSFQIFSIFAVVDQTQTYQKLKNLNPTQPNPAQTNPTHGSTQTMDRTKQSLFFMHYPGVAFRFITAVVF